MSLDDIIRRNISFVGCILIIVATELSKISRSLFIALQWRRNVFRRQFRLIHTLCIFVGVIGVIGLLCRPLSICKSCELIRYLAFAVMRWFPFIFKMYGSTHKHFFTNEYVRSLLELSISYLHRCVNILTIESLKQSMHLFVLPMCCISQA